MYRITTHLPSRGFRGLRSAALTVAILAAAIAACPSARAVEPAGEYAAAAASTPLAQAVHAQADAYRQQQWQRLSARTDRDSLIAAVLLGSQRENDTSPIAGHEVAEARLAARYGHDSFALFALALACQQQSGPCARPDAREALLRVAPDNALHWLLLPNGAAPSDAQLHAAARAPMSDTRLREITSILHKTLAGQPAPAQVEGIDARVLATALRDDAVGQVELPQFAKVMRMCMGSMAEPRRSDCLALGRRIEDDRSGSILARMIGTSMVRRIVKGTPEEAVAKEQRRIYVWMSDQVGMPSAGDEDRIQRETVAYGEWVAWQRACERVSGKTLPPADWMPKDPTLLLLSEERAAAAAQH
ncbi:MAG: hypothetical protein JSR34_08390 [Proteobacteria bacterium]|nr:hypothetical protein [Pseudomonadota bacterium]